MHLLCGWYTKGVCSVCRIGSVLNLMVVRCVIAILSAGFTGADQLIPGGMSHWDVATEYLLQASSFFLSFVIADGTLSAFQTHLVVDFAEYCDNTVTSLWAVPMVTTINPRSTWLARAKRPPSSRAVDLNCETALCVAEVNNSAKLLAIKWNRKWRRTKGEWEK